MQKGGFTKMLKIAKTTVIIECCIIIKADFNEAHKIRQLLIFKTLKFD